MKILLSEGRLAEAFSELLENAKRWNEEDTIFYLKLLFELNSFTNLGNQTPNQETFYSFCKYVKDLEPHHLDELPEAIHKLALEGRGLKTVR